MWPTLNARYESLPSLKRFDVPYRIGLVEGGEWTPPADLQADPLFKGYVIFLLPE